MSLKAILLLVCAAIVCQAVSGSDEAVINRIYNNIIVFDLETAVKETKQLSNENKGDTISQIVQKLTKNNQHNIIEYAFKLWNDGGKEIIKRHFPIQFRMLFDQNSVKIINRRDNLALKLGMAVDSDGDRIAYGTGRDTNSIRVSWKFIPILDGPRVYFKILNVHRNQYLKLGVGPDSDGEYMGYSETASNTFRHQWYLRPVSYEGSLLFYIFNREHNQALKLGRAEDGMGDRLVWGHNGEVNGKPDLFGWSIKPF